MTPSSTTRVIFLCLALTLAGCSPDDVSTETPICSDATSDDNLDQHRRRLLTLRGRLL